MAAVTVLLVLIDVPNDHELTATVASALLLAGPLAPQAYPPLGIVHDILSKLLCYVGGLKIYLILLLLHS